MPAESAASLAINSGETITVNIRAFLEYSGDVLKVKTGESYEFTCSPNQHWKDWFKSSGPHGYINLLASLVGLRVSGVKCFCLCGIYGRDYKSAFKIGSGLEFTIQQDGLISFFANDNAGAYWNNSGSINLQIKRLK